MDWEWLQAVAGERFDVLISRKSAESFINTNSKRWKWVCRLWNTTPTGNDVLLGMLKIDMFAFCGVGNKTSERPAQVPRWNIPLDDYDRVNMRVSYAAGQLYRDGSPLQEVMVRKREEIIAAMNCDEVFA